MIVAVLSLTLNMLRDCKLDREEYRLSALIINYFSLGCVSFISVLNIIISAVCGFCSYYAFVETQSRPWGLGYAGAGVLFSIFSMLAFRKS